MYLSKLMLNPTSRRVRTEIGRPYELHRTLMQAFPAAEEGPGRVLFRPDISKESNSIVLLVQSEKEPDWRPLEDERNFLLGQAQSKLFAPVFRSGQPCRFRLRANPTVKRQGKRFGIVKEDEQLTWLHRKGTVGGFEPMSVVVSPERKVRDKMTDRAQTPHALTLVAVRFDGFLQVKDPEIFHTTLAHGLAAGKALDLVCCRSHRWSDICARYMNCPGFEIGGAISIWKKAGWRLMGPALNSIKKDKMELCPFQLTNSPW